MPTNGRIAATALTAAVMLTAGAITKREIRIGWAGRTRDTYLDAAGAVIYLIGYMSLLLVALVIAAKAISYAVKPAPKTGSQDRADAPATAEQQTAAVTAAVTATLRANSRQRTASAVAAMCGVLAVFIATRTTADTDIVTTLIAPHFSRAAMVACAAAAALGVWAGLQPAPHHLAARRPTSPSSAAHNDPASSQ